MSTSLRRKWRKIPEHYRTITVLLLSLTAISSVIIASHRIRIVSPSEIRTIILSTVAITSLYIAVQKFVLEGSHEVQIFGHIGRSTDDMMGDLIHDFQENEEDPNPIKKVGFTAINIGSNPITLRSIRVLWGKIEDEQIVIGYSPNTFNYPIDTASGEAFEFEDEFAFVHIMEAVYIDTLGDFHTTGVLRNKNSFSGTKGIDNRKLHRVVQQLSQEIKENPGSQPLYNQEEIPFDLFNEKSEEEIVQAFMAPSPLKHQFKDSEYVENTEKTS